MKRLSSRGILTILAVIVWTAGTLGIGVLNTIQDIQAAAWQEELRMHVEYGEGQNPIGEVTWQH